ncbi:MAG TPA: heparan-alpha-glucosaminide N-acetyltransferase domain-containing protein [Candidatus Acidoferrales bacterium]|nr:heparan-alpha-glucosaminide N-acetyltransferase domain-containing protein [Candidatus Acidoferrales bacterium]
MSLGHAVRPPTMATAPQQRIAYIDWMRGFACLAMFQTHCYDSWVAEPYRHGKFMMWSQLGGTLPAPLFLFLAGISFAMVTDGLRKRGALPSRVAKTIIMRGAEILGFGLLFRLQEYLLGLPWAPWTDLLRVDVLNVIGISMMLMGCVCWAAGVRNGDIAAQRVRGVWTSACVAMLISLATPPLWTTWRPRWLPWPLESYINGVHIFDKPQPWLFPIFPWTAFAFAGLACGFILMGDWARRSTLKATAALGTLGIALAAFSVLADSRPRQLYAEYDYWHTSPNFFLMRTGILLVILLFAYSWCRWGLGRLRWDPLVQLGKTSLLVYWVHIEFVYGRFSFLPKRGTTIASASVGLLIIFLAMLGLSLARTRFKGRGLAITRRWKRPEPAAAPGT